MIESINPAEHLRRWMLGVMASKEWNAEEWANKAGTTPTNITRFLKGSDHIPSYATLVKLALVAGVPIPTPGVARHALPKVSIALLNLSDIAANAQNLPNLIKQARQEVASDWHGPRAFAVRLEYGDYADLGYQDGDIVVVDPDLKPELGKHVLATTGKGTGPVRYDPPHFIRARSLRKHSAESIVIIGTIVELIRYML